MWIKMRTTGPARTIRPLTKGGSLPRTVGCEEKPIPRAARRILVDLLACRPTEDKLVIRLRRILLSTPLRTKRQRIPLS